jgi:hypothetical protein
VIQFRVKPIKKSTAAATLFLVIPLSMPCSHHMRKEAVKCKLHAFLSHLSFPVVRLLPFKFCSFGAAWGFFSTQLSFYQVFPSSTVSEFQKKKGPRIFL